MQTDLTLDDMILRFSENPFVEEKEYHEKSLRDSKQKKKQLSKFLLIAGNLFERFPETIPNSYKRRYEYL